MRTSEKIDQIATSLFAMRKELTQPTADQVADAGSYTYPYLSLPALIEFLDKKGSALSLSYTQEITRDGDGVNITTRLMHSSGQWIELGPLFLPVKGNAQAWGSAISYGRRYALAAAFGIAPKGEDDDASAASSPARAPEPVRDEAAEREAGGEVKGTGEGPDASPPASQPSDAQRWMDEFHPGKPHKMKRSETVPKMTFCTQGNGKCPYAVMEEAKA
jgi:hypothetical protein